MESKNQLIEIFEKKAQELLSSVKHLKETFEANPHLVEQINPELIATLKAKKINLEAIGIHQKL